MQKHKTRHTMPAHKQGDAGAPPFSWHSTAINALNGRPYVHHPALQQVQPRVYPLDKDFVVEVNGLLIPAGFDCDNLNDYRPSQLAHYYYFEVPSRTRACHLHQAAILSGARTITPELPLIDDEYFENVAVFHAVLRAAHLQQTNTSRKFVFAEVGARWGTWGARAIAFARAVAPSGRLCPWR